MPRFKSKTLIYLPIQSNLLWTATLIASTTQPFSINHKQRKLVKKNVPIETLPQLIQYTYMIQERTPDFPPTPFDFEQEQTFYAFSSKKKLHRFFAKRHRSLTHTLTMKILIHKREFDEAPIDVARLTNYLMRRGQKTKFLKALTSNFLNYKMSKGVDHPLSNPLHTINFKNIPQFLSGHYFTDLCMVEAIQLRKPITTHDVIFTHINSFLPSFALISERVSKKVRKFTRGKSGRYTRFWVYLPPHKRQSWVCQQLAREIRFGVEKKLRVRIGTTLQTLISDPSTHFLTHQIMRVYRIIFKNYRQTLIKTYRRERQMGKQME